MTSRIDKSFGISGSGFEKHSGQPCRDQAPARQGLNLADLLDDPVQFTEKFAVVCQLLYGAEGKCWLAENYRGYVAGRRAALPNSKRIKELLYENFPPYGGGRAIFITDCSATVELERGEVRSISQCDLKHEDFHLRIE